MPFQMPTENAPLSAPAAGLDKRDWIAGLEKGLHLIESFDDAHSRMTASQVGERCGMTRTAARRYLLTLQHLGYVATDGKLFWLTPRVLRLGSRIWSRPACHGWCSRFCRGSQRVPTRLPMSA